MTAEIRKINRDDPLLAPYQSESVEQSQDIWAGFWNGELALIWGLIPVSLLSDKAYIWSVGTPILRRCAKTLLRLSRLWLKEIAQEYPELLGLCDQKTAWVKHLGAEFEQTKGEYALFTIRAR